MNAAVNLCEFYQSAMDLREDSITDKKIDEAKKFYLWKNNCH